MAFIDKDNPQHNKSRVTVQNKGKHQVNQQKAWLHYQMLSKPNQIISKQIDYQSKKSSGYLPPQQSLEKTPNNKKNAKFQQKPSYTRQILTKKRQTRT